MKKKGFTLIELLAVIVILAIIALIAVPIILNIIGSSKKSAVLRSGELYLKAVETAIARENLNNQFNPTTCIIEIDGNLTCDGDKTLTIEVNGSKPTSGTINLNKGKIITVESMILDGNELKKEEKGKLKLTGQQTNTPVDPENPKVELNPQGTYLMKVGSRTSPTSTFLGGSITRDSVETIEITNTKIFPSGIIESWDVSEAKDGSVMAWYTDIDNNNLYELYIGGEDGVKANPDSSYLFSEFTNTTKINLKYLDTSEVTNMNHMFFMYNNCKLEELDISSFDTSKVVDMSNMFFSYNNNNITSLDVSKFDTSEVTNMNYMFAGCSNLTALDVSKFKTSKVTDMSRMFWKCEKLTLIDVSNFNTSSVIDMNFMFYYCKNLENIELGSFDTSKVTDMKYMFSGCSSLTKLDLSSFNTSEVTDMYGMFSRSNNLTELNLSSFDTSKVTNVGWMFSECRALTTIDMRKSTFSNVTDYGSIFSFTNNLTTIYVKDVDAQTWINKRLAEQNKKDVTVTIA